MVAASRITPGKKASGSKDIELSQLISERIWTRSLLRFPKGKQEKILNNIGKISVNTNNTKTYTMGQNIYINTLKCSGYDHAHTIFHDGVSNYQPHHCLLNRLFGRRSRKASKLRVTGLCAGNSPGPVNSPHKGPVTRKMVPVDDPIMAWVNPCNDTYAMIILKNGGMMNDVFIKEMVNIPNFNLHFLYI